MPRIGGFSLEITAAAADSFAKQKGTRTGIRHSKGDAWISDSPDTGAQELLVCGWLPMGTYHRHLSRLVDLQAIEFAN